MVGVPIEETNFVRKFLIALEPLQERLDLRAKLLAKHTTHQAVLRGWIDPGGKRMIWGPFVVEYEAPFGSR